MMLYRESVGEREETKLLVDTYGLMRERLLYVLRIVKTGIYHFNNFLAMESK